MSFKRRLQRQYARTRQRRVTKQQKQQRRKRMNAAEEQAFLAQMHKQFLLSAVPKATESPTNDGTNETAVGTA